MSKPHKKSKRSYRKKKARRMKEHAKETAVLNSYKPYKLEVRNDWSID